MKIRYPGMQQCIALLPPPWDWQTSTYLVPHNTAAALRYKVLLL